jgi:hypothetical protein
MQNLQIYKQDQCSVGALGPASARLEPSEAFLADFQHAGRDFLWNMADVYEEAAEAARAGRAAETLSSETGKQENEFPRSGSSSGSTRSSRSSSRSSSSSSSSTTSSNDEGSRSSVRMDPSSKYELSWTLDDWFDIYFWGVADKNHSTQYEVFYLLFNFILG